MPNLQLSGAGGSLTIISDERPEPSYWHVTLASGGLNARTRIDLDSMRHQVAPIGEFFAALATDWRGWEGARQWGVGPLVLSATHDGLGHVDVDVHLKSNIYDEPDWQAQATVGLEAGALLRVAREAAQLPSLLAGV